MSKNQGHTPDDSCAQVDVTVIERLSRIGTGTLSMQLFRRGIRQCFLRGLSPLNPSCARFAGEAYTMRLIPSREDVDTYDSLLSEDPAANLQWYAVENIRRGQVMVVDSRGDGSGASGGDILLTHMMVKGVKGIVTDGSLRDASEIGRMAFPAYAREVCATTRVAYHHVADVQVPISCAGVAVYPGDIMVGDGEGVVVIPRSLAPVIVDAAEEQEQLENYIAGRIAQGEPLAGLYPPTDGVRREFNEWLRRQEGADSGNQAEES